MRRRQFITLLGGAAAWPLAARAQQAASVTVCDADGRLVAFQRMDGALAEAGRASIGKALASARSGRPSGDESIEGVEDFRVATVIGEGAPLIGLVQPDR